MVHSPPNRWCPGSERLYEATQQVYNISQKNKASCLHSLRKWNFKLNLTFLAEEKYLKNYKGSQGSWGDVSKIPSEDSLLGSAADSKAGWHSSSAVTYLLLNNTWYLGMAFLLYFLKKIYLCSEQSEEPGGTEPVLLEEKSRQSWKAKIVGRGEKRIKGEDSFLLHHCDVVLGVSLIKVLRASPQYSDTSSFVAGNEIKSLW